MQKLSHVTKAIIALFNAELQRYTTTTVDVLPTPPDPEESGNSLHVYLYHAKECAFNKNLPASGGAGPIPIQHTPLYLVLQYILSAVHNGADADNEFDEQDLMGFAARAVHDYPILTSETRLGGSFPLQDFIEPGLELELVLRPAPPEETVAFYSAGQQQGLRFSLFVEARVALLAPDPPETTLPGIVLSLGTNVAPMDLPMLVGTSSKLTLLRGNEVIVNETSPGRVALFASGYTAPSDQDGDPAYDLRANNHLAIETSKMLSGKLELRLEGNGNRVRVPLPEFPLAPAATNPWQFTLDARHLAMNVLTTIDGYVNKDQTLSTFTMRPGLFSAQLMMHTLDGALRVTNKVPFFVSPHLIDCTSTNDSDYTITISGDYLLLPAGADPRDAPEVQVSIGNYGFKPRTASTGTVGTFTVQSNSVSVQLPATGDERRPTGLQPILLMVNGVPALPIWREISG